MLEVLTAETGVRIVYRANHNEEGGRFWKKSNENVVAFLDDERVIETDLKTFPLGQPEPDQGACLDGQRAQSVRQDDFVAAVTEDWRRVDRGARQAPGIVVGCSGGISRCCTINAIGSAPYLRNYL